MTDFKHSWGFEKYPVQISHKIIRVELKDYLNQHGSISDLVEEQYLTMFLISYILNQKRSTYLDRWHKDNTKHFEFYYEMLYDKLILNIS